MLEQVPLSLPSYSAPVLAAARVGIWQRDPHRGVFRADEVFAAIFGLSDAECAAGVALDRVAGFVHPQDRHIFAERVQRAKLHGGLMVAQYRICPEPGVVRWILVQGRYESALPGQTMGAGQGIAVDVTDSLSDGADEPHTFFLSGLDQAEETTPLDRASDHALAAYREIASMGFGAADLQAAARFLLYALGRRLARETPFEGAKSSRPQ
jgi:hypothetical protein